MWPNSQEATVLLKFTEEILYGKIHFLCSDWFNYAQALLRRFYGILYKQFRLLCHTFQLKIPTASTYKKNQASWLLFNILICISSLFFSTKQCVERLSLSKYLSEAFTWKCSVNKNFWRILQKSQECPWSEVLFM